jgi:metal-dependent amidase/aminoacylase/carboxypeptidase family protein
MVRSDEIAEYAAMRDAFEAMCQAAATATGTTVEVTFSGFATTMINNPVLVERFRMNMAAYGVVDMGDDPNAGSTDMANVSWVCPTIHPDLAICDEGVAGHSIEFRDAAALPRADETTLLAATLIGQTAVELFLNPALVDAAWASFREATAGRTGTV